MVLESSWTGDNLFKFGHHPFEIDSHGTFTTLPLPCPKSTTELSFLEAIQYHLRFCLDFSYAIKVVPLQFQFQSKEQGIVTLG